MHVVRLGTALIALAAASPALAAGDCGSGTYLVIHTSRLAQGGSLDGFKQAMADQAKWYATHGSGGSRFEWGPAIDYDRTTRKSAVSKDTYVTLHWETTAAAPAHDAGWDKFVAEYKKNSQIVSSSRACMNR